MPAEGVQILAQVQALLQQFIQLGYDTPVKDQAIQWLDDIGQGLEQLRAEPGASNPAGEEIPGEAESPAEDAGEPQPEPPPGDGFKAATAQVKQDMGDGGLDSLPPAKGSKKKKPQPA